MRFAPSGGVKAPDQPDVPMHLYDPARVEEAQAVAALDPPPAEVVAYRHLPVEEAFCLLWVVAGAEASGSLHV